MAAQPKIVVALDAELEELIERNHTGSAADAKSRLNFVVIAVGARQPASVQRTTERSEQIRSGKVAAYACFCRGIDGKAPFGQPEQRTIGSPLGPQENTVSKELV